MKNLEELKNKYKNKLGEGSITFRVEWKYTPEKEIQVTDVSVRKIRDYGLNATASLSRWWPIDKEDMSVFTSIEKKIFEEKSVNEQWPGMGYAGMALYL